MAGGGIEILPLEILQALGEALPRREEVQDLRSNRDSSSRSSALLGGLAYGASLGVTAWDLTGPALGARRRGEGMGSSM